MVAPRKNGHEQWFVPVLLVVSFYMLGGGGGGGGADGGVVAPGPLGLSGLP
jgi:hypothetical protein